MKKINVLSPFGGMEKPPIACAKENFPDIIHIGSVTDVRYDNRTLFFDRSERFEEVKIDFLIGGPPCQDLSIAGKRAGLDGERSGLFWEFVRILNETKPEFFFMENVASMPKEAFATISEALGFEGVKRNAAVVSAQNRKRYYWLGKRNPDGTYSRFDTPEPADRGLVLRDILENIPFDAVDAKGKPIWKPLPEKFVEAVDARIEKFRLSEKNQCLSVHNTNPSGKGMNGNVFYDQAKSPTVTTNKGEGNKILGQFQLPHGTNPGGLRDSGKAQALTTSEYVYNNQIVAQFRRNDLRVHEEQYKVCTLTANMGTGGHNVPVIIEPYCLNPKVEGKQPSLADRIYHEEAKAPAVTTCFITNVAVTDPKYLWRKLTVRECLNLQGFSLGYKIPIANSPAYECIGNSWQVDEIEEFWKYLPFFA